MQAAERIAIIVAGVAGTGKTTLGRALAAELGLPLLDLDPVTVPLLDEVGEYLPGGHWMTAPEVVRAGRYAALRETARDVVRNGPGVVLVAPFTAELRGGPEWDELRDALSPVPVHVVYLRAELELVAARRARRGAERDLHRPKDTYVAPPRIPVIEIDATVATDDQVRRVLSALSG